jgi:diamine N-acetyltransferase
MTHTSNATPVAPPAGLRIRRATLADAELISTLGAETFVTSFGAQNTPENLAVTYLIAELSGRVAGYAQVREGGAPQCVTGVSPVEVRRFYVLPDFHGTGLAQALMNACADEARRRGGRTLWLGVWDRNPRAIRFYTKWGFEDVGGQTFMLGDDPQNDRVLARSLEDRA